MPCVSGQAAKGIVAYKMRSTLLAGRRLLLLLGPCLSAVFMAPLPIGVALLLLTALWPCALALKLGGMLELSFGGLGRSQIKCVTKAA